MRRLIWLTVIVLCAAIGAKNTRADSFTSATLVPVDNMSFSGSFIYDNTTNEFTSFGVSDGQWVFYFDHNTFINTGSPIYIISGSKDEQAFYLGLLGCTAGTPCAWSSGYAPDRALDGGMTLDGVGMIDNTACCRENRAGTFAVVTPEPSTLGLVLFGVMFVFVMQHNLGRKPDANDFSTKNGFSPLN